MENEIQTMDKVLLFESSYYLGKSISRIDRLSEQTSRQSGLVRLTKGDSVEIRLQGPSSSRLRQDDAETFFGLFLVANCDSSC